MSIRVRLQILADAAKYDASCASSGSKRAAKDGQLGDTNKIGICHSYTPDGRCVSLLKILLTNYCIYDCQFCINRVSSDTPRARFTPEEVAWLTLEFYRRNYIEGLFLSSGIIQSPDYTMEQLVQVVRLLRETHHYNGYIHLKVVPGASEELIALAGKYSDRVSANIELPTQAELSAFAPEKKLADIDTTMHQIQDRVTESNAERKKFPSAPRYAPAGQSTQMVIGASPSTDSEILRSASDLYGQRRLRRVYYSAYSPILHGDARLPVKPPPLIREHRLYQADWLIRFYGFQHQELTTPEQRNLDLEIDPKLAWALAHREEFPVDLNRAPREKLLRIPGIGARNVSRILKMRRWRQVRLEDLSRLRISIKKTQPFVIAADHNPEALRIDRSDLRSRVRAADYQLELFGSANSALTGEV